jgi:hypothetical protein
LSRVDKALEAASASPLKDSRASAAAIVAAIDSKVTDYLSPSSSI